MIDSTLAVSAVVLGLSGAGHCLGMCGGIASLLSVGGQRSNVVTVAYHGGRISSYTLLGAALALLAGTIDIAFWTLGLRYLAGLLLIAMGLYIANWWLGMAALERLGAKLWQPVQRFSRHFLPVRHWPSGFALGLCWGLMPCGLIYSSLAFAATTSSAVDAATLMLLFGLGTLPAMLATSLGAQRLARVLRDRSLKRIFGMTLIVMGAWSVYVAASHAQHAQGDHHLHPAKHHVNEYAYGIVV